jgi:ribonuclease P protein component
MFQLKNKMLRKRKKVVKKVFNQIMKEGLVFFGTFFIFRYLKNNDLPQYAVVVPKKLKLKAVKRNKLKRQGYYLINSLQPLNSRGIFFFQKKLDKKSFQKAKEEMSFVFKKFKIIN